MAVGISHDYEWSSVFTRPVGRTFVLRMFWWQMIDALAAVREHGSKSAAARALGIPRTTFRRMVKRAHGECESRIVYDMDVDKIISDVIPGTLKDRHNEMLFSPGTSDDCGCVDALMEIFGAKRVKSEVVDKEVDKFLSGFGVRRCESSAGTGQKTGQLGDVVFLPDVHAPYDDMRAVDIAIEHAHRFHNPKRLILGGDFADLFEFSDFPSTPRMTWDAEVAAVVGRLEYISNAFPEFPKDYLMGNHERRALRKLQRQMPGFIAVLKKSYAAIYPDDVDTSGDITIPLMFQLHRMGITFRDNKETWARDEGFLKIGKLMYCHGDELPGCSGKYAALRVAENLRQNVIYGHLHQQDASPPTTDHEGHTIKAFQVGCLHTRTPHYNPGKKHSLGFAVVEYDTDGSGHFTVHNYLIDDCYKVRR